MTRIVVIGVGYVGIPCAALFADVPGVSVVGIQRRSARSGWTIDHLKAGLCPFDGDEPGLGDLVNRMIVEKGSFRVSDDYPLSAQGDVIFADVQAPTKRAGVPNDI